MLSKPIKAREITVDVFTSGEYDRSEEHTSELQSHSELVFRLLLEKKNILFTV